MRRSTQHWIGSLLVVAAAVIGTSAGDAPAQAAPELRWFVQLPGFIVTDLRAVDLAYSHHDRMLYALGESNGVYRITQVDTTDLTIVGVHGIGTADRKIIDLQVSEDGTRLYALTNATMTRVHTTSWGRSTIALPRAAPWQFDIAPDDPMTFVLWNSAGGDYVYHGNSGSPITGLPLATDAGYVFGPDSATLYRAGRVLGWGEVTEFDMSTNTIRRSAPAILESGAITLEYVNGELWSQDFIASTATLAIEQRLNGFIVARNATTAYGHSEPLKTSWRRLDTATRSVHPYFVIRRSVEISYELTPMDGTTVAIIEPSSTRGAPGFVDIVDTAVLDSNYGELTAIQPARVLDTRAGVGGPALPVGPGARRRVLLTGVGGVPDSGVEAVVMNVTVAGPTAASFFTIWPAGDPRPTVSNLNFLPGQVLPNLVTVPLGRGGAVDLYNADGSAHAIFDVVGYYSDAEGPDGGRYVGSLRPERLIDTRTGLGGTRLGAGRSLTLRVGGPDVVATVLNVTAVGATSPSYLTVWPANRPRPTASNLNLVPGGPRANLVVSGASPDGFVKIYNAAGSVDVLVDFIGYYGLVRGVPVDQTGRLLPTTPFRRFDSRVDHVFPPPGYLEPDSGVRFVSGDEWTELVNVTAIRPTKNGFLSVVPYSGTFPTITTSTVNFTAGSVVANAAYALGYPDYLVYNSSGSTHMALDVFGWLTPPWLDKVEDPWS